jgi:hypothetical protein
LEYLRELACDVYRPDWSAIAWLVHILAQLKKQEQALFDCMS